MSTSKITLLSLPNEMLLRVRSHLHSLQDHVYFARTCKTTQSLYNEDFFRFAVRSSGWGRTAVDQKVQTGNEGRAWTTLAGRLVEDARIFQLFEEVPDWSRKELIFELAGTFDGGNVATVKSAADLKRAGQCLALAEPVSYSYESRKPGHFAIFELDHKKELGKAWQQKMLDHPYLANRFLTSPLVDMVDLDADNGKILRKLSNKEGVTVYDVYQPFTARPPEMRDGDGGTA